MTLSKIVGDCVGASESGADAATLARPMLDSASATPAKKRDRDIGYSPVGNRYAKFVSSIASEVQSSELQEFAAVPRACASDRQEFDADDDHPSRRNFRSSPPNKEKRPTKTSAAQVSTSRSGGTPPSCQENGGRCL